MSKHQKDILRRAERNLTNYADGGANETIILENADPNVDAGIDKFFTFTVTNNNGVTPAAVALVPANYDTERYQIDDGAVIKTYDNIDALRAAGYMVDGVLAEGTADYTSTDGTKVDITCAASDPMRSIKFFLDYIKLNPQGLKHMDIIGNNINQWTGNMTITFCNPFFKNKEQRVNLNTFFSRFQYQSDRIGINFDGDNRLEFSDLLLFIFTIPAGASATFVLTF